MRLLNTYGCRVRCGLCAAGFEVSAGVGDVGACVEAEGVDCQDVALGHMPVMRWNPQDKSITSQEIVHVDVVGADCELQDFALDRVQPVPEALGRSQMLCTYEGCLHTKPPRLRIGHQPVRCRERRRPVPDALQQVSAYES
jgi:hypothetical protein